MKKTSTFSFLYCFTPKLIFTLLILSSSWPANAATVGGFAQYNLAFIVGMVIPVLIILVLLNSVADIRLRYPFVISLTLIAQLYLLQFIEKEYVSFLFISASAFISAMLFSTIGEKLENKLKALFTLLFSGLFIAFLLSVLFIQVISIEQLWLGFILLNLVVAFIGLLILSKKLQIGLLKETITLVLVLLYGIALYLWELVSISENWIVFSAIAIYLMFVVNYCSAVVKHRLFNGNNELELSQEIPQQANESIAVFDPVTNLPNYHQSLHCLRYYNGHDPSALAIIVFKPINFSQVNKVLGHHNSDILLLQLAYTLQKAVVDNPLLVNFNNATHPIRIARLQGLDFVMALDSNASQHPVKILIEQLCQQLKAAVPNAMSFKSFSLNFDLRFGVAFVNHHQNDLEQTIAFAGDALLDGEQNLQLIRYFNQEAEKYTEQKLLMMEKLKQDIIDNNISWVLQPQIALNKSQLIGFELMSDWRSTNGNMLDVNEFIEVAEYSGEAYRLARQMIEQACKLISLLHREHFYIQVSVNLFSKDVLEHDLIEFIEQVSSQYHTSLRYLVIELDETLLFEAPDKAKLIIDQLKSIGVKVLINNFSGSYEALRYLRRLAIDQVKVNCSQLVGLKDSEQSEKIIISALINLVRKMKVPLYGSGINNSEIKNTYLDIGGDIGQGNLITEGIRLEDAKKWTAQWLVDHVS